MTAAEIARRLGGRESVADWVARCPAHDDTTASRDADGPPCHAVCKPSAAEISAQNWRAEWRGEEEE